MEFEERQHLNLWWLHILAGIEATIVVSIVLLDKGGMKMQELKDIYFLPFIAALLPFIIIFLVQKSTLVLKINNQGINYRYKPFARKTTFISWTQINKMYIRKYDALSEYGGWGKRYRLWFKFNDKAFVFNNESKGLQLELSSDKKLLFSTEKVDELALFLINLKTSNNIGAIETDVRER
ncbi:MAG: hypothetical protein EOO91_01065 [Pedobacter sp.]|nr:MAG: hypothetical protein EOO91_01065 [Pedobacter sp.]